MRYWKFTLLEDAFFFLNQAKSLSNSPTARAAKARFIRCSVMLSWQALEDATKDVLKNYSNQPFPFKFSEKLKLALALLNHTSAFNPDLYHQNYRLRNDVVHVNAGLSTTAMRDAGRSLQARTILSKRNVADTWRSTVARFRLYDLRHTWATRAAMSGIDLVTLTAMLGHSRIQMVLRYAHPTDDHQAQAMKRVEEFSMHLRLTAAEKPGSVVAIQ
jgi:hypothetical protein